jgi:phosphoglycolate phosphatase
MNEMLHKRQMKLMDVNFYKDVFGFPVIDYYKKLGFNFEKDSFENLSKEFIDNYSSKVASVKLAEDSELILRYFQEKGKNNIILSAMQKDMLSGLVEHTGLKSYFSDILGIENIYAHSKSSVALDYIKKNKIPESDILLIGDTLHDFEVALAIGCKCILITHGHQSLQRLQNSGATIINSLKELTEN